MLMLGDTVVQAKPAATYHEPNPDYTPVYLPNIEYRDHRGLVGQDLAAYNATKARLVHYVAIATQALKEGKFGTTNTPSLIELRKLGCTNCFLPTGALVLAQATSALNQANAQLAGLQNGMFPFATFTNVIDNSTWVKTYDASTNTITIKAKPPESSGWGLGISWIVSKVEDAIVWVENKVKAFVASYVCKYLTQPGVQALLVTAGTATLAASLATVGVPPYLGKIIAGFVVALGVSWLAQQCGLQLPAMPNGGGPPTNLPGPIQPTPSKYPVGSISRYNTDHNIWMVYAPQTSLHGLGTSPSVVPAVPDGFTKVAEEAGPPSAPPTGTSPQGTERDARWYDSKLVWIGGGLAVVGVVVYATKRRHTS